MKKVLLILTLFLSSCFVYEGTTSQAQNNTHSCELMDRGQACLSDHSCCKDRTNEVSYWRTNYASTLDLYYYNSLPYWGYYSGHYYYYGYRHLYPWWYYYNFIPPYYYGATTHVHCHIGNSGYVYRPRGNWRHNNKTHLTYHHDKIHNTGVKVKNNSNVPTKWKDSKIKINNNTRINVKPNSNKTNTKINIKNNKSNKTNTKVNTNRSNNKVNINKSNSNRNNKTNINRNNSNKTKINRSNNRKPK